MRRRYIEPIDLMVAIGVCATLLGYYLFLIGTHGTLRQAATEAVLIGSNSEAEWVQPVLGKAIVEDYLLRREASHRIAEAVKDLNRTSRAGQRLLQTSPFEKINEQAMETEAEHIARVQFVMGRSIVDFTARGVRIGALSARPEQYRSRYNQQMIGFTEAIGEKMEEEFNRNWQATLGQAIVSASQARAQFADVAQERIGTSIVQVASIRQSFQEALDSLQEQLGSTTFVATPPRLTAGSEPTSLLEPRTWPEIPFSILIGASAGLIVVFLIALFMLSARPQEEAMRAVEEESTEEGYHKVA